MVNKLTTEIRALMVQLRHLTPESVLTVTITGESARDVIESSFDMDCKIIHRTKKDYCYFEIEITENLSIIVKT